MKRLLYFLILLLTFSCKKESTPTLYSVKTMVTPELAGVISPELDSLIEENEVLTFLATPSEGYVFSGWVSPDTTMVNPLEVDVIEATLILATFTIKSYPLEIEVVGEGEVTETLLPAKDYDHGSLVQLEAVPDTGWVFAGWIGDYESPDSIISVEVNSEMKITANFEIKSYPLEIEVVGEGEVKETLIPAKDYDHGSLVQLEAVPDTGWAFVGWTGDHESTDPVISIEITSEMTITATFEIKSYSLEIEIIGDGEVTETVVPAKDYNHGTFVRLEAIPDTGWEFVGWTGDYESMDSVLVINMNRKTNIIANFELKTFPVTINMIGNGTVTENGGEVKAEYEYGSIINLKAIPDSMWVFRGWSGNFMDQTLEFEIEVTSPLTFTAIFEEGVLDYCVPTSLNAYRITSASDSINILEWDYFYDGRFITSYNKRYDYTKNGDDNRAYSKGKMEYTDGKIAKDDSKNVVSNVREVTEFQWNGDQISDLKYFYLWGEGFSQKSTEIVYEEPCGLSKHSGEEGEPGDDNHGTFTFNYNYSNNCNSYSMGTSDFEITYSDDSSIFKDVEGIPGFLGALYEDFIFKYSTVLLPNKDDRRLAMSKVWIPGHLELGTATETYSYQNFISGTDYPRYFIRHSMYSDSRKTDNDSFIIEYYCGYK